MIQGIEFYDSEDILEVYSEDASRWYKVKPKGVFFPRSTEEVLKIVQFCCSRGVSLTPRGGGSGLTGGAVPEKDGFVISLEKMDKFSFQDGIVVSEAGAISGSIERKINSLGFTLPAQPSSLNFSTIGGNVAANSAGLRSIKYGSMSDYILAVEVVLPTGKIIEFHGEDARIFAGSEGILGIIASVRFKVVKKKNRVVYTIFLSSPDQILEIFNVFRPFNPSAFEVLDDISSYIAFGVNRFSLILEFEEDYNGIFAEVKSLMNILSESFRFDFAIIPDTWERRKRLGPALSKFKPFKINEDVVIPISLFSSYLRFIESLRKKIDCISFGHLGVGILHTNIMFGGGEEETAFDVKRELFDFIVSIGGSITGEHGVGIDKLQFVKNELGDDSVYFVSTIKSFFDPQNILNPGKVPRVSFGCVDTLDPRFQKV